MRFDPLYLDRFHVTDQDNLALLQLVFGYEFCHTAYNGSTRGIPNIDFHDVQGICIWMLLGLLDAADTQIESVNTHICRFFGRRIASRRWLCSLILVFLLTSCTSLQSLLLGSTLLHRFLLSFKLFSETLQLCFGDLAKQWHRFTDPMAARQNVAWTGNGFDLVSC